MIKTINNLLNFTHKTIQANGIQLHVVHCGPQDGPLVVMLHGFPEFWFGWRKQIPALAEAGYRVLVPDQRGYNLSDKPKGVAAYHINKLAQDVIGLIEAAGRKKAIIVGHDWGGAIAWHLAIYYPQWVERLVILNVPHSVVLLRTLTSSWTQLKKSWYMFFFQIPWLPEWLLARNNAHWTAEILRRSSATGTFSESDLAKYREAWLQPGALTGMINWYRNSIRAVFSRRGKPPSMKSIKVPTLLIWGAQDTALGREMAQPSIDLCTDGRLVFIEDATHWVQHEKAEQVNELLLGFLKDNSVVNGIR